MNLTEPLGLDVDCAGLATRTAALLVLGDGALEVRERLCSPDLVPPRVRLDQPVRLVFGLAILTEPYPILVNSLMTEHNARLDKLSLFAWIEENAILEPRAEILGRTPAGESPVLFLRDLDVDRPPEAWIPAPRPAGWLRVTGVALTQAGHHSPVILSGDEAALAALDSVLPPSDRGFVAGLRAEVARGVSLRAALRARRKAAPPDLMHICEGWRILSRAARFARLDPTDSELVGQVDRLFRLDLPRTW